MTIAVFGAVGGEIAGLLLNMKIKKIIRNQEQGDFIYEGIIHGKPVVLVRTGVGIERAKDAARIALYLYKPELVVSTGWAGATKEEINREDIVVGVTVRLDGSQPVNSDPELCSLAVEVLKWRKMPFHLGGSLTVPRALLLPEEKKEAGNTWRVSMVEMESYEVISAALREKIPCLEIRVISDACGEIADFKSPKYLVNRALDRFLLSFIEAV